MKRVDRIARIRKIKEFALKEKQIEYAGVLKLLREVEDNLQVCLEQENMLIRDLYELYSRKKTFSSDELVEIYQQLGIIRRWKNFLLLRKAEIEKQLELLRNQMLERKQEKDIMQRLEEKFYLDLLKDVSNKETKEADENAVQRFVRGIQG